MGFINRRLWAGYRPYINLILGLPAFYMDSWLLKMGPIGCPETSLRNYYYSPRNNPEKRSSHTRKFITAFTSPRRTSSTWARSIQSMSPHPTFWWSILILSFHLSLDLPSALFPSGLKENSVCSQFVNFHQIVWWSNQVRFVWHVWLRRKMLIKVLVGEDVEKRSLRTRHRW